MPMRTIFPSAWCSGRNRCSDLTLALLCRERLSNSVLKPSPTPCMHCVFAEVWDRSIITSSIHNAVAGISIRKPASSGHQIIFTSSGTASNRSASSCQHQVLVRLRELVMESSASAPLCHSPYVSKALCKNVPDNASVPIYTCFPLAQNYSDRQNKQVAARV